MCLQVDAYNRRLHNGHHVLGDVMEINIYLDMKLTSQNSTSDNHGQCKNATLMTWLNLNWRIEHYQELVFIRSIYQRVRKSPK